MNAVMPAAGILRTWIERVGRPAPRVAPLFTSRLIVFAILACASIAQVVPGNPPGFRFQRPSTSMFHTADAENYLAIAKSGYRYPNQVYFALFHCFCVFTQRP